MGDYGEKIDKLNEQRDQDYKNYLKDIEKLRSKAENTANNYNVQIGIINSERHLMREEMNRLYDFLSVFNDIGETISPFDFKPEELVTSGHTGAEVEQNRNVQKKITEHTFVNQLKGNIWNYAERKAINKKRYEASNQEYENEKTRYEHDKGQKKDYISFVEQFAKIADIYRAIIAGIRDSIKIKVIPELEGVRSFIYADAVKNSIIEGCDPGDVKLLSIVSYQNTPYAKHYQFVKNTFAYYKMISSIFKEAYLTNLLNSSNHSINDAKLKINKIKDDVEKCEKSLDDNKMF